MDPTDGTAVPGNTNSQLVQPSGTEASPGARHPDCDRVEAIKSDKEKIRKAFEDHAPERGEDAGRYYGRIGRIFGIGEPGGAKGVAWTDIDHCTIGGDRDFFQSQPDAAREAACAHERSHQEKCRHARDNAAGGYRGWLSSAANTRQDELDAYAAEIKALNDWMNKNCR
jgi:hypothetical protein